MNKALRVMVLSGALGMLALPGFAATSSDPGGGDPPPPPPTGSSSTTTTAAIATILAYLGL